MSDAEDDYYGNGWQLDPNDIRQHLRNKEQLLRRYTQADLKATTQVFMAMDFGSKPPLTRAQIIQELTRARKMMNESRAVRYCELEELNLTVTRENVNELIFRAQCGDLDHMEDVAQRLVGQQFVVNVGETINIVEERDVSNDPDFLRREAQRMLERAEILETVPKNDDLFADGQVITLERTLGGQTYKYAAIKIVIQREFAHPVQLWYVTGEKAASGIPWNEFIDWMGVKAIPTIKVIDMDKVVPLADFVRGVQKALEGEVTNADEAK
jgi:hypothetical protein